MIISKSTQLGLMFQDMDVKKTFGELFLKRLEVRKGLSVAAIKVLERAAKELNSRIVDLERDPSDIVVQHTIEEVNEIISEADKYLVDKQGEDVELMADRVYRSVDIIDLIKDEDSKYFYICDSVYKCADLIKVSENFTARAVNGIRPGKYTYLMGKTRMLRFVCAEYLIKGIYFDSGKGITFEFILNTESGKYYYPDTFVKEFSMIMQLMIFIELGDIEIVILETGRNNGKPKRDGKITNTEKNTIYVVDSTWNQIIHRTEGFAVRGHFRLQPCGVSHKDRKLTWISAFEKHGYKRQPKARIVHN